MTELFPEKLSAAGVAAKYCSEPEVWAGFESWMRRSGYLDQGAEVDREFMLQASFAIRQVIRQIEIELVSARLTLAFENIVLQFPHVAGSGSMRRNEYRPFLPPREHRRPEGGERSER